MLIGIDESNGLVYEGSSYYGGRLLWPSSVVTPAAFYKHGDAEVKASTRASGYEVQYYFREDFFDPVSRIRRGRIYKNGGSQPVNWHVLPHPAAQTYHNNVDRAGMEEKRLLTYASCPIARELESNNVGFTTLVLGAGDVYSQWSIVGIECVASNEELITLKAKQNFGVLPEVDWNQVPESFRAKVQETIKTLLDDVHRAGPESVIDRCRDAAAAILRAYLGEEHAGKDLGKLILALSQVQVKDKKQIVISASEIIRVFHPRAKPSEKERRTLRPIREHDAELAVQCVGTILCELGWDS